MKKTAAILLVLGALAAPSAALATPSFGPGGSDGLGNNDPQEQGAQCHPPGQTSDNPNCK